jgi:hypothetical protein
MPAPVEEPKPEDPTQLPDGPPEEEFWERYNKRLEFPLGTVTAVFVHVLIAAVLVLTFTYFMKKEDRGGVPVSLVPDMGGLDDAGEGSAGSGGVEDPIKDSKKSSLEEQLKVLPDPSQLPVIKENIREALKFDNEGNIPVSDFNAAAYSAVDKTLAEKLLGVGNKKGAGPGAGSGEDGSKGTGVGGTGADSTRARSLRWVLRFSTDSGEDYVAQLAAMNATILVPLPPNFSQGMFFTDLRNLSQKHMSSDADLKKLAGQIKFSDTRPESVRAVCQVLGVKDPGVKSFWAFFPRTLEDELARKEVGFRNRRPENIEETIFRVVPKGGTYEIRVDDQKAK